ncbi:MAG: nuclear transport factor 2 family protein [Acinetobacter sp.]|uniref:nuclear transport factor 2 family protein n=1 Tax=Acinetobacter sp. TaxID=472 RepID=UPI000FAE5C10|nr:nuclear transport factor 2 family protein [Acinetobacter sp.]RUP42048.1 MAG: nuclear transport factor 2 family protein [Acinetobacter sp.]
MNTTDNLDLAESYYNAMLAKDFDKMAGYLHNNVHFIGPIAEMHGKESVVAAAKNFGGILQDIQIRSRFVAGDQIMFAYDMVVPAPIGKFRAAVLMELKDLLISKIELFYDASPFQEKKSEIFEANSQS